MMASSATSPVLSGSNNRVKELLSGGKMSKSLTTNDVYQLGTDIAQEMQKVSAEYGQRCVGGIVEKVVRALEWLETYVEELEELRTLNYKLMLKADEAASQKERAKQLQSELKVSIYTSC